jgi:hypothetical protein
MSEDGKVKKCKVFTAPAIHVDLQAGKIPALKFFFTH